MLRLIGVLLKREKMVSTPVSGFHYFQIGELRTLINTGGSFVRTGKSLSLNGEQGLELRVLLLNSDQLSATVRLQAGEIGLVSVCTNKKLCQLTYCAVTLSVI